MMTAIDSRTLIIAVYSVNVREFVLDSEIGERVREQGIDTQPEWAGGATVVVRPPLKVFLGMRFFSFTPLHVVMWAADVRIVQEVLRRPPWEIQPWLERMIWPGWSKHIGRQTAALLCQCFDAWRSLTSSGVVASAV